jgi:hypothetical protein
VPPVAITAMRFVRPIKSGASDIFIADDTLSASPLARIMQPMLADVV